MVKPKRLLLVILCFLVNQVFSQMDLTLGPELKHENGAVLYKIIGKTEDAIFSLWMDTNGKQNKDEYYLEKHDLKSLSPKFSVKIELPKEDQIDQLVEKVFMYEDKIYILNSSQSPRYKKKVLFLQIFDSTGKRGEAPIAIDSIEEKSPRNTKFQIYINKEGTLKTIVIQKSFYEKKVENLWAVSVFSLKDLSRLNHKTFIEKGTIINQTGYHDFKLEENGQLHYMKWTSKKEKKKFQNKTSLFINEKEIVIGNETDTIKGASKLYLPEEKAFLVGGYKIKNLKLFSFICLYDETSGTKKLEKEIEIETKDDKKFVWQEKVGFKKMNLNFWTKHLFYSQGNAWVVGEQQGNIDVGGGGGEVSVEAHIDFFYNLIASSFSLKSDEKSWSTLPKREYVRASNNNRYEPSTIAMFTKNKELYVLYQNSFKNFQAEQGNYNPADLEHVITNENTMAELAKINCNGEIQKKAIEDKITSSFQIRAVKVPKAFVRSTHNVNDNLFLRLSDNSFLIYFEEGKLGHWGVV